LDYKEKQERKTRVEKIETSFLLSVVLHLSFENDKQRNQLKGKKNKCRSFHKSEWKSGLPFRPIFLIFILNQNQANQQYTIPKKELCSQTQWFLHFLPENPIYILACIFKKAKPNANPKRVITKQQLATVKISPIFFLQFNLLYLLFRIRFSPKRQGLKKKKKPPLTLPNLN